MDSKKESRLNMFHSVIDLCENNLLVIALVVAFETAYNTFKTTTAAIVTGMTDLETQTGGLATAKKTAKNNLANLGSGIAGMVYAYAVVIGDEALQESMNISASKIKTALDDEVVSICNNIYSTANGLVANLGPYGVTALLLTTFQTAITDYSSKSPKPKQSKNQKKAIRQQVNQYFKEADALLINVMDKLVVNFISNGNALFESQYRAARVIVDPASFTTVLKLVVINGATNEPLKSAKCYRDAGDTFKRSSKMGVVTFKDIEQGNHTFLIKHKLFNDLNVPAIPIGYGNKKTVTVVMFPTGSNGIQMISKEGNVTAGTIAILPAEDVNPTPATIVTIEVTENPMVISASDNTDPVMGPVAWTLPIGTYIKTIAEFAVLIGATDTANIIKLQSPGPNNTHYKITFTNLQG